LTPPACLTSSAAGASCGERFKRALRRIGHDGLTIRGLRATVAAELAEAGFTDEQIVAIAGHTRASSLKGYTGDARQKARAGNVMKLRDGG
jgi:integrase